MSELMIRSLSSLKGRHGCRLGEMLAQFYIRVLVNSALKKTKNIHMWLMITEKYDFVIYLVQNRSWLLNYSMTNLLSFQYM